MSSPWNVYDRSFVINKFLSLVLVEHEADCDAENAHDEHVVHGHPHVLAVVQRGDLHVPRLPRKEGAKHLSIIFLKF